MRPDADEMVYRTKRTYLSPVFHRDVSAQRGSVGQDHVVSNTAIVRDVGVRHHKDVTSNASQASTFDRTPVDGDKLSNLVVIADFQAGGFSGVGQILRRHADRGERKESIVRTNFCRAFNGYMGNQIAALTEFYVGSDGAIWANFTRGVDLGLRIDDGRRMYAHRGYVPIATL